MIYHLIYSVEFGQNLRLYCQNVFCGYVYVVPDFNWYGHFFSKQLSSIECCVGSIKWIANTLILCVDISLSQRWAWNNIQITNLFILGKCQSTEGNKVFQIHHQSTKAPVSRFNLVLQVWLYQTCVIQFGLCTSWFSLKNRKKSLLFSLVCRDILNAIILKRPTKWNM